MGEFAVSGMELKKMVKIARKQPVPFAFNPGKSDAEHYLGMHRKRAASLIGKEAKKEGPGPKVAFGNAEVDGKCLNLTCERVIPALAKRVKRYLKYNKVMLNVQVLDAEGNLLESDIQDDLPDDPSLYDEPVEGGELQEANEPEPEQEQAPGLNARALAARLLEERNRMAPLGAEHREKLAEMLQQVAGLIKAGNLEPARDGIERIAAAIDRLLAASEPQSDTASDPDLMRRIVSLRDQIAALENTDAQRKLAGSLKAALKLAQTGQNDTGANALDKIEAALASLAAAAKARSDTGIAEGTVKKRQFLITRWKKIPTEIKAEIGKLRETMLEDVPEEDPASLTASIEKALDDFCDQMQDAIDDAINAGDPGFRNSVKLIDDFRTQVQSHALVQHIKNNPFNKAANVEPVILNALNEIKKVLAA